MLESKVCSLHFTPCLRHLHFTLSLNFNPISQSAVRSPQSAVHSYSLLLHWPLCVYLKRRRAGLSWSFQCPWRALILDYQTFALKRVCRLHWRWNLLRYVMQVIVESYDALSLIDNAGGLGIFNRENGWNLSARSQVQTWLNGLLLTKHFAAIWIH